MLFQSGLLAAAVASVPTSCDAFVRQPSLSAGAKFAGVGRNHDSSSASLSSSAPLSSSTRLSMAFDTKGESSNMFEGPMALVKERDACGVGFIANTQSGGESKEEEERIIYGRVCERVL